MLEAVGLTKHFGARGGGFFGGGGSGIVRAVDGISFKIERGQMNNLRKMASQMGGGMPNMGGMGGLADMMPPGMGPGMFGGMGGGARKPADRDKLKKLRKDAKKARKKNRKK